MAQFGSTDLYLSTIKAFFRSTPYCLQTSPEYHMKRLLASGSGPIFQLARVFRDDELGRWHNPEFTLLEWYQVGIDHHALMTEMDSFLQTILGCGSMVRKTYRDVFMENCGIDPFEADVFLLKQVLQRFDLHTVLPPTETCRDVYLFLLMSHVVEPALAVTESPVAVYNFPPSQAALARVVNGVAERFEVYYHGVELANGFHELTDVRTQRERFEQDRARRQAHGVEDTPVDTYLLEALAHGLPPCSGVALGVDRLVALALNEASIANTMAFDFSRA